MTLRSSNNMKKLGEGISKDQKNGKKCNVSYWNVENVLFKELGAHLYHHNLYHHSGAEFPCVTMF